MPEKQQNQCSCEDYKINAMQLGQIFIQPLEGEQNWNAWKRRITALFKALDIYEAIERKLDHDDRKNSIALFQLLSRINDDLINRVPDTFSAYEIWIALKAMFEVENHFEIVNVLKNILKHDYKESVDNCKICIENKMNHLTLKPSPPKADIILGCVHGDICGPFEKGVNGFRYFATFIDEKSHLCTTVLMKNRTEIFSSFKEFIRWAETDIGSKIQSFVSVNVREYHSQQFIDYCKDKGINIINSPAYTPQCNGISERKNRSLCTLARCLLNEKNLPRKLWPFAIEHANRIQNRSPSEEINNMIPSEVFFKTKKSLSRYKKFGSLVWVLDHQSKNKISKRSKPMILVGVEEYMYKMFDPTTDIIVRSSNVRIVEDQQFNFSAHNIDVIPAGDVFEDIIG